MTLINARSVLSIAFRATIAVWGIGEQFLRFRDHRSRVGPQRSQDAGSLLWVVGGVVGGFAAGLALAAAHVLTLPGPTVWLIIGLIVAWTGILLRVWAVRTLGQFFTVTVVIQADHRVISRGPYRLVRHPSYLGIMLILFGFGLALADLASLLAMVILPAIGLAKRITVEEAALRAGLGDSYVAYCEGRNRLIPGIW